MIEETLLLQLLDLRIARLILVQLLSPLRRGGIIIVLVLLLKDLEMLVLHLQEVQARSVRHPGHCTRLSHGRHCLLGLLESFQELLIKAVILDVLRRFGGTST